MATFKICPNCGAALDPGERCDCNDTEHEVYNPKGTEEHKNENHQTGQAPRP